MNVVYDTGALIAAERNDRRFAIRHRELLARGVVPIVPATVLAQVWAASAREALLARVLRSCETDELTEPTARRVGALRAETGHHDIVDVSVVECARRGHAAIVTSDPDDITAIADQAKVKLRIEQT